MTREPNERLTDVTGASRILDVTPNRVRQMDAELLPQRLGPSRRRVYSVEFLQRVAAGRRKAAR